MVLTLSIPEGELDRLYPDVFEAQRRVNKAVHIVIALRLHESARPVLVPMNKMVALRAIREGKRSDQSRVACELRENGLCVIGVQE